VTVKQIIEAFFFVFVVFKLVLRWRHLLNHDPGHGVPPGVSMSWFLPHTVPDINSHTDDSFVDSLAEAFNLSGFVYVGVWSAVVLENVVNTINGEWAATFYTVEGEIPALTAIQTTTAPEVAIELHFQGCVIGMLHKSTVLYQPIVSPIIDIFPSTLFPVSLRDLGRLAFSTFGTMRAISSLFPGCSHRPSVALVPTCSVVPGHPGDTW